MSIEYKEVLAIAYKREQYNKSLQANWQARFLISRFEPTKAL